MEQFFNLGKDLRRATLLGPNLLSEENKSMLVIAKDKSEIVSFIRKLKNDVESSSVNFDIVCVERVISSFEDVKPANNIYQSKNCRNIKELLLSLVNYANECKTLITKARCKSLSEYNIKYKEFDRCRTIVIIPEFDKYLKSDDVRLVKECISSLVKLERYSGVSVIVCSILDIGSDIDFKFLNIFSNRVLFNVGNDEAVRDISLGMYRSTEMLGSNEFYYFSFDSLNGMMMTV